jgi:hypothetical protein
MFGLKTYRNEEVKNHSLCAYTLTNYIAWNITSVNQKWCEHFRKISYVIEWIFKTHLVPHQKPRRYFMRNFEEESCVLYTEVNTVIFSWPRILVLMRNQKIHWNVPQRSNWRNEPPTSSVQYIYTSRYFYIDSNVIFEFTPRLYTEIFDTVYAFPSWMLQVSLFMVYLTTLSVTDTVQRGMLGSLVTVSWKECGWKR